MGLTPVDRNAIDTSATVVFVLAAGTGSRLAPLTDRLPKPLIPLDGEPILERNIRTLADAGYRELIVNLHHLPEVVIDHFRDGSAWGVDIDWSLEPALLGTAGALLAREQRLRAATFLVVYGDNLLECDVAAPLADHRRFGATLTVTTIERLDPGRSGVVRSDETGRITEMLEKPGRSVPGPAAVNAGLLVCEPRVLDFVPTKPPTDLAYDVIPALLSAGEPLYATPLTGRIRWIDTPDDLEAARSPSPG